MRFIVLLIGTGLWGLWTAASKPEGGSYENAAVALHERDVEGVKRQLAQGLGVNEATPAGMTLLMEAAMEGQGEMVGYLLTEGADVGRQTSAGWTALMLASSNGHTEVVRLLLAAGAPVNAASEEGVTAARIAREHGYDEILALLRARVSGGTEAVRLSIEPGVE